MHRRPLVLCIVAIAAMVLVAAKHRMPEDSTGVAAPPPVGLLGETLRRCRDLGPQALADDDCRAAWAQSRQVFLFPARQPTRGAP